MSTPSRIDTPTLWAKANISPGVLADITAAHINVDRFYCIEDLWVLQTHLTEIARTTAENIAQRLAEGRFGNAQTLIARLSGGLEGIMALDAAINEVRPQG
jgi:hypothetical protein